MLEAIDCAVLIVPSQASWVPGWISAHRQLGRVRLHGVALGAEPQALSAAALALRRYDVCMLPVVPQTLSWTRMALACAPQGPSVPLLGMLREIRAAALRDLLALGMTDFVRETACDDELQARLAQLARLARVKPGADGSGGASSAAPAGPIIVSEAIAPADAVEPFRQAKSRIVATFERDYLTGALARHAGNISSAARAARKHRRAFWALMRKHRIDAAPFREAAAEERRYG